MAINVFVYIFISCEIFLTHVYDDVYLRNEIILHKVFVTQFLDFKYIKTKNNFKVRKYGSFYNIAFTWMHAISL